MHCLQNLVQCTLDKCTELVHVYTEYMSICSVLGQNGSFIRLSSGGVLLINKKLQQQDPQSFCVFKNSFHYDLGMWISVLPGYNYP